LFFQSFLNLFCALANQTAFGAFGFWTTTSKLFVISSGLNAVWQLMQIMYTYRGIQSKKQRNFVVCLLVVLFIASGTLVGFNVEKVSNKTIEGCELFSVDDAQHCITCMQGQFLAQNKRQCLPKEQFPYCSTLDSNDKCEKCDDEYILSPQDFTCISTQNMIAL